MIGFLLQLINPLGRIADRIADVQEAKAAAQTDREKLRANIALRQLEARQAILLAESKHRLTRWIRPAMAAPFAIYIWKVVVWDKVLGWGVTDPLDDRMWWIATTVVGAYFLTRPFEKWMRG